jgi:hypothetical protein
MRNKGLYTYIGDETSNLNLNGVGFDVLTMTSSQTADTNSWYASLKIVQFNHSEFKFSKAFRQHMKNALNENVTIGETLGISVLDADEAGNPFSVGDFILINDEVMKITAVDTSGNTIDVDRAQWGTSQTIHSDGAQIFKAQPGLCHQWVSIRNVSSNNKISIQAESVKGNPITKDSSLVVDPTNRSDYLEMEAQDNISGAFDVIHLEEPPEHGVGSETHLTLIAMRG